MVRYFYAWTPLVIIVGSVVLLTIPYLALIALMLVLLAALVALARAIVIVPYVLSRRISRSFHLTGARLQSRRPDGGGSTFSLNGLDR